jgi:hypothetical protein
MYNFVPILFFVASDENDTINHKRSVNLSFLSDMRLIKQESDSIKWNPISSYQSGSIYRASYRFKASYRWVEHTKVSLRLKNSICTT